MLTERVTIVAKVNRLEFCDQAENLLHFKSCTYTVGVRLDLTLELGLAPRNLITIVVEGEGRNS